ncbi:MAG: hypothetical protein L6R48_16865 [Planctomycetes bacterium]|nr:hypothetical protein [Planctomycetota bacterium]
MPSRTALPTLLALALAGSVLAEDGAQSAPGAVWPAPRQAVVRGPGGTEAFSFTAGDGIQVAFKDRADSDDYLHLDLGAVGALAEAGEGSYLELEASAECGSAAVLRISLQVADPGNFWPSNMAVEGKCLLRPGTHVYRFWLDGLQGMRLEAGRHHLYLMLHDLTGPAKGAAGVRVGAVTAHPGGAGWRELKRTSYREQYQWPVLPADEAGYRQHYERAVPWADLAGLPQLRRTSLDGAWSRRDDGERTWDAAYLADAGPAGDGEPAGDWRPVTVPEPDLPGQAGGHRWYRRTFELAPGEQADAAWLRFDELAELGHIWLNGTLVGTQTPSYTAFDWYGRNTSRHARMYGIDAKAAAMWRNFDRCGMPFPWERAAIPEQSPRVALPMQACHHPFPHAWTVSGLLRPGRNVLAVRVYANPMDGWWVTRTRGDRAGANHAGLLAPAALLQLPAPAILAFAAAAPAVCGDDGIATHRVQAQVAPAAAAVRFWCAGAGAAEVAAVGGRAEWTLRLPAGFARASVRAAAVDRDGRVLDQRELSFPTAVVEVRGDRLVVNGDRFVARGINARMGIEWDNERVVTRRQAVRDLELYRSLGINALRGEFFQPWELDEALAAGLLVMPTTVAASTDWMWGAFGNLERPDLELATDRQRNAAVLIAHHPAIMAWNGANELHHTPGYEDAPVLVDYLERIRASYRRHDPAQRPVTFANLDNWGENPWFFLQGQDLVGWNVYRPVAEFARDFAGCAAAAKRPLLFTEWGTYKGKPDREGAKVAAWEADMAAKWELIARGAGSAGGFLFPHHGELDDQRGLAFLRQLFLPVAVERTGAAGFRLRNRDACPWRALSVSVLEGDAVLRGAATEELAPGGALAVELARAPAAGSVLLVRGTTHRGLVHEHRIPW